VTRWPVFIPGAVEILGDKPQLHDEVARQVGGFGLATLFLPQPDQRVLVAAHDDAGVRAADEMLAVHNSRQTDNRHDDILPGYEASALAASRER
jgi:hypothetical protein